MDLACKSGVGASQIPALTPEQQDAVAKYLGNLSTQYSRAAAISVSSGNLQAVLSFEVAAALTAVLEQMVQPSTGKVVVDAGMDTAVDIVSRRTGIPKALVFEIAEREVRPGLNNIQTKIDGMIKRSTSE
jgi:NADPH-dependent glutamate synthase beta subunit-like oxidoreductase